MPDPNPYAYPPSQAWAPYPPVAQGGYPVYPPAPRRRRGTWVALGVVLALLVGMVGFGAVVEARNRAEREAALAATRATVTRELPRLEAFVATHRGHAFVRPVTPEVLDDAGFVRALRGGGDRGAAGKAEPDDLGATFTAMGLVDSPDSFYLATSSSLTSNVVGFYDDETGRLVVRGVAWSPEMEYTLVHELTHALQDQTFDLGRLQASARTTDESKVTIRSVIEGDATRVAEDYYDAQPAAWQRQVDAAESGGTRARYGIVDIYLGVPYVVGSDFVSALADLGGNAAVDKAFRTPPTTTAQLLRAEDWYRGALPAPAAVAFPVASGDVLDKGVLGQLGLWATVESAKPNLDDTAALDGWAGDAYTTTEDAAHRTCFTDESRFVSDTSRDQALQLLQPWTAHHAVEITRLDGHGLRLSRCTS